jgi:hypothetical protein
LSLLLLQQLLVDIVAILVKHLLHGMNIIFHLSLCLEKSVFRFPKSSKFHHTPLILAFFHYLHHVLQK